MPGFCLTTPTRRLAKSYGKGGEIFANSKFTLERIPRAAAQALSHESSQEWPFERCPSETLVRF
jgi:hypothetical protein